MRGLLLTLFYVCSYVPVVAQELHAVDPASPYDTVAWRREREFKPGSMLKPYSKLFKTLHGKSRKVYFKKTEGLREIKYDDKSQAYYGKSDTPTRVAHTREVMGWHLHWMETECAYYPYALFSTISFFAYDIDAQSGACTDADAIYHWLTSAVHDSARVHGTHMLLTLTSYGTDRNKTFLDNRDAWMFLSDTVRSLIRKKKAHGIDVDFNGLQPTMKTRFTEFIRFMRHKLGDSITMTLQIPYNAALGAYDLDGLKPLINTFVVQGFDYQNPQCGNAPLPMAPLQSEGGCPSLEKTVDAVLHTLSPERVIVGFPLYGTRWQRTASGWKSLDNMPYENIRAEYDIRQDQDVEPLSGSSVVRDDNAKPARIVWYEGHGSLDLKFGWINEKGLKGAGLWGLGYDGNQPEIWNTVTSHFATSPWQKIAPLKHGNGRSYSMVSTLHRYRKVIGVSLFIIIGFFLLGLLFSLLDWRVRDAFFHSGAYRGLFAGALILAAILAVYLVSDTPVASGVSMFTYGILTGGVLVYITSTVYLRYKNKLP